jgi:metal-responsive CopG/Arc/MetJ family transcriptional regulator
MKKPVRRKPEAKKQAAKKAAEPRSRIITVGLPPKLIEQIDAAAKREHRSRTNLIEVMIWEGLDARRVKDPEAA